MDQMIHLILHISETDITHYDNQSSCHENSVKIVTIQQELDHPFYKLKLLDQLNDWLLDSMLVYIGVK